MRYLEKNTQTLLRRKYMAIQEYRETGGEKWDYEDTPQYWQQRDAEEKIIMEEIERQENE
jgi:hypothetical protein